MKVVQLVLYFPYDVTCDSVGQADAAARSSECGTTGWQASQRQSIQISRQQMKVRFLLYTHRRKRQHTKSQIRLDHVLDLPDITSSIHI